jgi:hypothetical protein
MYNCSCFVLQVGQEVEYSVYSREKGGKVSAEGVKLLAKGSIPPPPCKEESLYGKVVRPLRSVNPDQVPCRKQIPFHVMHICITSGLVRSPTSSFHLFSPLVSFLHYLFLFLSSSLSCCLSFFAEIFFLFSFPVFILPISFSFLLIFLSTSFPFSRSFSLLFLHSFILYFSLLFIFFLFLHM